MQEDVLAEHERHVRWQAAGELRARLDQLIRAATGIYLASAGDTRHKLPPHGQELLRATLIEQLDVLIDGYSYAATRGALRRAANALIRAGADDIDPDVRVNVNAPIDLRWALPELTTGMRDDLKAARKLARVGKLDRYGDLLTVIGAARKAVNRADRTAAWVTHRAHNEGRMRAALKLERQGGIVSMFWRPERDACATCLGYAGAVAEPGEPFVPVFEVGDASARPAGPVHGPWDMHPWCRCQLDMQYEAAGKELTPLDLPYALRREAQRSVASGMAQGSEPGRVRAADRLLQLGDELLINKTTQRKARRAIEAGGFDTPS